MNVRKCDKMSDSNAWMHDYSYLSASRNCEVDVI